MGFALRIIGYQARFRKCSRSDSEVQTPVFKTRSKGARSAMSSQLALVIEDDKDEATVFAKALERKCVGHR